MPSRQVFAAIVQKDDGVSYSDNRQECLQDRGSQSSADSVGKTNDAIEIEASYLNKTEHVLEKHIRFLCITKDMVTG